MKLRRMGLEWGAAFGVAHTMLISSSFETDKDCPNGQVLIYEREGGGLTVEIPLGCELNVYETTLTEHENKGKGERVLSIDVENAFNYVPNKR